MEHYTKTLPYELELTSRVLHEAAKCFFEQNKFPISQEEFVILDCLHIHPNIIQMELAKLILKGRAHTGKFLKSLESKKYIIRTPIKQESKIVMKISITKEGLELYKKICDVIDLHVKEITPQLHMEIEDIRKMLQYMRQDLISKYNIRFD